MATGKVPEKLAINGGVRIDDIDLRTFELQSAGIHYVPLAGPPDMYLAFAAIGRAAWDSLNGKYLNGRPGPHGSLSPRDVQEI